MAESDSDHPGYPALGAVELVLQDPRLDSVVCVHVLATTASVGVVGKVQLCIIGCIDGWRGHQRVDDFLRGRLPSQVVVVVGNTVSSAGVDGSGAGILPVPARGYFGPEKGTFP